MQLLLFGAQGVKGTRDSNYMKPTSFQSTVDKEPLIDSQILFLWGNTDNRQFSTANDTLILWQPETGS